MNDRVISLLVVIILLMGAAIGRYHNMYSRMKSDKENVQKLFSKKIEEVEVYKNRFNNVVAKNEAVTVENRTMRELVEGGKLEQLKQLEGINRRMSNLEFAYKITARALDSVKVHLQDTSRWYVDDKGDTLIFKATDFKYSDKWSSFKAKQIRPDSSILTYSVTAPLTGAMYWKRKYPILWIFSKKEYFGEVFCENPHVVIPELLNVKVGKKK